MTWKSVIKYRVGDEIIKNRVKIYYDELMDRFGRKRPISKWIKEIDLDRGTRSITISVYQGTAALFIGRRGETAKRIGNVLGGWEIKVVET